MKQHVLVFLILCCTQILIAQAPEAFNYQGIARDDAGTPLINKSISLHISILENEATGTAVFRENHFVTTNKLGLFSIEIGNGESQTGQLSDVDWGSNPHFIQIEMDASGGTDFVQVGTSQLLSVPYALYASKSGSGGGSQWIDNATGIHYNQGNVGIGTENPGSPLTILSDVDNGTTQDEDKRFAITLNNPSLSDRSWTALRLVSGQPGSMGILTHHSETYDWYGSKYTDFTQLASTGKGVIITARESDGLIKFLTGSDASLDAPERMRITHDGRVGIGTESPTSFLTIVNDADNGTTLEDDKRWAATLNNPSTSNRSFTALRLTSGQPGSHTHLSHHSETYNWQGNKYTDFGQLESNGKGIVLRASAADGIIKFLTGSNPELDPDERMRISSDGNIGIGTENPASRLQVTDGDVYIEDINKGVIMKSPDGNCWRMTINNDGSVSTTSITCPN